MVLASNNAAKLREISMMLHGSDWDLVAQGELGVSAAEEPHPTFIENALAKARHGGAARQLLQFFVGIVVAGLAHHGLDGLA